MYTYVCVCVHICGNQSTCMCEEVSSSIILHFNSFETASLNLELSRQAGWQDPGVFPSLPPQFWDYRCVLLCQVSKVWTQVPILVWQSLCQMYHFFSILPCPLTNHLLLGELHLPKSPLSSMSIHYRKAIPVNAESEFSPNDMPLDWSDPHETCSGLAQTPHWPLAMRVQLHLQHSKYHEAADLLGSWPSVLAPDCSHRDLAGFKSPCLENMDSADHGT